MNTPYTIEELIWRKDADAIRVRLLFVSIMGICEGMAIVYMTIMLLGPG